VLSSAPNAIPLLNSWRSRTVAHLRTPWRRSAEPVREQSRGLTSRIPLSIELYEAPVKGVGILLQESLLLAHRQVRALLLLGVL